MREVMRDFAASTLWRVSAFERVRAETGTSGFMRLAGGPTLLPSTLMADLRQIEQDLQEGDVLEVIAACIRHREPALLCLQHEQLVWPITVFPDERLYHSPRDMAGASADGLAALRVLTVEPPGVKPPGHWMHERVGQAECYRQLAPLLWTMALNGPRRTLLSEIGGTAAYRVVDRTAIENLNAPGALGSAIERLRRESVSMRDVARMPGMNIERAARLLNALYLTSSLMVTRTNPAARSEPGLLRGLFGSGKARR
jgi:hypothetical protein